MNWQERRKWNDIFWCCSCKIINTSWDIVYKKVVEYVWFPTLFYIYRWIIKSVWPSSAWRTWFHTPKCNALKERICKWYVHVSITVNAQNQSVPIMDKEVHGNKQYNLLVYSKTFQSIHNNMEEQRQEVRKSSWKSFVIISWNIQK